MTPAQALRYLERRMVDAPATEEQTVTDELAFDTLWNLALRGSKT
jgi:hypothetical protein